MDTMTAKDFQTPLLQVLGTLTDFKAASSVRGEDTYSPVMAILGITDINALGEEASSGQPLVARLIQWACKNLRKTGHVTLEGRGQWVLTDKGVQEALRSSGNTHNISVPGAPSPSTPTPMDSPMVVSRAFYLEDPYILRLVLDQTPCLGHYTAHKGAECVDCPVTVECRNTQSTTYARIAIKLAAADAQGRIQALNAAAGTVKPPAPTVKPPAPTVKSPAPISGRLPDMTFAEKITAFAEVVCQECGRPILKNTQCMWIEDPATSETRMYHPTCVGMS